MARPAEAPSKPSRNPGPTTARRLLVALGAILTLFAIALVVLLRAMDQLDRADAEVGRLHDAREATYRVATLIREQYIHQAHTIIEGNRSHIDHYEMVAQKTRKAVMALRAFDEGSDDGARIELIARLVRENDDAFHAETLPAVDAVDREKVRDLHAATERVLDRALLDNKTLSSRFEQQSDRARGRAEGLRKRTRWTALGCFGLSAIVAVVLAFVATRRIASRVSALRDAARAIGGGDLRSPVVLDGDDEFADIARSMADMARDLETHQEKIVRAQKLASIGHVAAGVAHEINNPLAVILGYVKTMRPSERRDDHGLDVIEEEARQCLRIVAGLLELAKPQTLELEPVAVEFVVSESIERLRTAGMLGDRVVRRSRSETIQYVRGDSGKLRQVLLNVLTNAAEATPAHGEINIEVVSRGDEIVIEIQDSGRGIPSEVHARLFEPFVTTKKGGVGVGLAIAHTIIEAHGGRITCTNPNAGGALVGITLPKAT